jgi:hypothetical protein
MRRPKYPPILMRLIEPGSEAEELPLREAALKKHYGTDDPDQLWRKLAEDHVAGFQTKHPVKDGPGAYPTATEEQFHDWFEMTRLCEQRVGFFNLGGKHLTQRDAATQIAKKRMGNRNSEKDVSSESIRRNYNKVRSDEKLMDRVEDEMTQALKRAVDAMRSEDD